MIVWVASYPRSGNTLTRQILTRCFGAKTHSIYNEARGENLVHTMGLDAFCEMARASEETFFVKTHELPSAHNDPDTYPSDRTIYIARDGRAAMASHRHYLQDVGGQIFPIEFIVLGAPPIIGWGDHVAAWMARSTERQLVLRYEELSGSNRGALEEISAFLDRPILRDFDLTFAQLHEKNPTYYRVGRNEPGVKEIERACPAIFWAVNGAAMKALDYDAANIDVASIEVETLAEIRRGMMHARSVGVTGKSHGAAAPEGA